MVAKRLVHGALGVRTVKTPEQRAAEKEMLQAARGNIYIYIWVVILIHHHRTTRIKSLGESKKTKGNRKCF
jgi:hypothetical protein